MPMIRQPTRVGAPPLAAPMQRRPSMKSGKTGKSGKSLSAVKAFFNDLRTPSPGSEAELAGSVQVMTLHLPPSLADLSRLSPALWAWVTDGRQWLGATLDHRREPVVLPTRLAYASHDHHGHHGSRHGPLGPRDFGAPRSMSGYGLASAAESDVRPHLRPGARARTRLYIEVAALTVKHMSGVNAAALQIAATGSGAPVRTLTSLFPDKAAGRGKLCASLGEGFILDAASERAAISLDLFGGQVHDPFLAANSDTSFSTSFNTSRATLSFGKKAGRQAAVSLAGASSALIGEIHLGGCSLEFPAREHGVKTYTTVALLSGSKEIGSVSLGCAYFVEEDYSHAAALEAALPHVAPYADTLNVMRRANAAAPALWRKYYAVLDRSGLMLYDLEYRAHRPAVAYLEPCDIVGVAKADWAKMSAAHSLALAVSSTYVRRADAWAQSALEDEDDETPILYVAADSRERMTAWREAIEALVSYGRHKAMQQG